MIRDRQVSGRRFTVGHDSQLLEYLMEVCTGQSRTAVKGYLSHGQVTVNEQNITAFDFPLKKGDRLMILDKGIMVKKAGGVRDSRVKIVYEDKWLMVIDKRHSVLTMSAGTPGEATAYSLMSDYVKRMYGREAKVFIVHRLDRETSGLLILAKDQETQERLQDGWKDNVPERRYIAVTEGTPPQKEGTVTSWLTEHPKSLKVSSSPIDNGGKKAVTSYKVLISGEESGVQKHMRHSLVEFNLETGRKNQIRIHASEMGCPISGDKKYGAKDNPLGRLALHARSIVFRHPHTGKTMKFDTGIPAQFKLLAENGI